MEILFVIVGLAVGAGLTYLFIKRQLEQMEESHQDKVRRMREDLERDFELRIQTAVQGVQTERDRTIKQLKDDYEQRIATLQSQTGSTRAAAKPAATTTPTPLADPWDNRRNVAPAPTPSPAPAVEPVAAPAPEPAPSPEPAAAEPTPKPIAPVEPVVARPAIAQLTQAIYTGDSEVRAEVASELANHLMGAEAEQSLALLEKLAGDRLATVRVAALETLADAQIPDTIPVLEKALRDANPAVVRVASQGLLGMKGEAIAPEWIPDTLPSNGVTKAGE